MRLFKRSGSERLVGTGVVEPPNVLQSMQGRYFLGRSGIMPVPGGEEALVLLRNAGTAERIFVVSITVTSNLGRRCFVEFSPETEAQLETSAKVASAHRGAPEDPKGRIQMATAPRLPLTGGIGVFERLLIGGMTLVLEQEGRLVLEPGESVGVWFEAIEAADEIDVAFGWYEEPLR